LSQIIRFTKEWSCIILPAHPGGSEVGCLGIATVRMMRQDCGNVAGFSRMSRIITHGFLRKFVSVLRDVFEDHPKIIFEIDPRKFRKGYNGNGIPSTMVQSHKIRIRRD
jgi:hypothetical protein